MCLTQPVSPAPGLVGCVGSDILLHWTRNAQHVATDEGYVFCVSHTRNPCLADEVALKNVTKTASVSDLVDMAAFCDELTKLSSNRITAGLRIPGIANGTARGLASPGSASGKNLAKFQLSGPNKSMATGTSTTAHNPSSQLSAGATGFAGIPAPPPVL